MYLLSVYNVPVRKPNVERGKRGKTKASFCTPQKEIFSFGSKGAEWFIFNWEYRQSISDEWILVCLFFPFANFGSFAPRARLPLYKSFLTRQPILLNSVASAGIASRSKEMTSYFVQTVRQRMFLTSHCHIGVWRTYGLHAHCVCRFPTATVPQAYSE